MNSNPHISVVIPLFNKENYIKDSLNSVLNQNYPDFELIIVNDGSTDQSLKIINEINDPRIRIVNQNNSGVSAARNNGVKYSTGDYIAFLDADDIWSKSYLLNCRDLINKYPDAAIIGHALSRDKKKSCRAHRKLPKHFMHGYIDYFKVSRTVSLYSSSSVIIKREDFENSAGFNENLTHGEDLDLWIRLAAKGKTVYCTKELVSYRKDIKDSARLKTKDPDKHLISIINNYHFESLGFNAYKHRLVARLLKHYIANRVFYKVRKYFTIQAFMRLPIKYKIFILFGLIKIRFKKKDV